MTWVKTMKIETVIIVLFFTAMILGGVAFGCMNGWGFDGGESFMQYREFEQQMNEVIMRYGDF